MEIGDIYIEEMEVKDNFISLLDDDGRVTVQMSLESVRELVKVFDPYISRNEPHREITEVTEFNKTFELDLKLQFDIGNFSLNGSRVDTTNFYHDFDFEDCNKEVWNKLKELIK